MNFNCLQTVWIAFASIGFIPWTTQSHSKSKNSQRFLNIYKITEITPQPINVATKQVKKLNLPPLTLIGGINDKVKVINTGKSVEVINEEQYYSSQIYGGVLLNDTYRFEKIRFYWADNATGSAGSTIDHNGTPLEAVGIFYNTKYGSFKNALKYRDGLAQLYVKVGLYKNFLFCPFGRVFKRIQKAESEVTFTLGKIFQWFTGPLVAPTVVYYAYPGSYEDEETGKVYYCSTTIIYPPTLVGPISISVNQFKTTFLSLKNKNGKPFSNQVKQYPVSTCSTCDTSKRFLRIHSTQVRAKIDSLQRKA